MDLRVTSSNIRCCMVSITNYFCDARVKAYTGPLIKNGNMVDVVSVHLCKSKQVIEENGARIHTIPARHTKTSRRAYLLEYGYSFLLTFIAVTKLYFKNRYHIIHFHNMPDFIVFSGLIPKIFGAKIILDIHDPMPEVYMSKYPSYHGLGLKLVKLQEYLSASFADAVISANPLFTDKLVGRGIKATKITTIINFPDPTIFDQSRHHNEKNNHHERFTLIFPGTIAPRYGLDVAIGALPRLKEIIPNIRLLIIGYQVDYVNTLISLAEKLGVLALVEFKSSIPITEIPQQLVNADIGIYPALPDCHMSIAIPGKVLEYVMMGLPIVSSRLRIVEEIFGDSAIMFFEPGNIEQFAQCIIRLYEDPNLREKLVKQADIMLTNWHSRAQGLQNYFNLINNMARNNKGN